MMKTMKDVNSAGIGARVPHMSALLRDDGSLPTNLWLELLADNWLCDAGMTSYLLQQLAERFPLTLHGVGLSLGSITPLDEHYLKRVKSLINRSGAIAYSEHLSFSTVPGSHATNRATQEQFIPDLLPLPFTEEALNHIAERILRVQDYLGETLLIENISAYVTYCETVLTEGCFLAELVKRTGCHLLLDVNNLYVNQVNLKRSALSVLDEIPLQAVQEIHLAGYETTADGLIDAHNNPVSEAVWELFAMVLNRTGPVATLIEWDNDLPAFDVLMTERYRAEALLQRCQSDAA